MSVEWEEAKSVTRQVDHARAFAITKGWTVADAHVYVDDGKSGAEFERREGLQRMLAHRHDFDILIVSEQKSFGREMSETAYRVKQLDEAGVKVWSYVDGRCLTPGTPIDKLLTTVQSFSDEDHRYRDSQRTRETLDGRAKNGYVAGGRVYGYRNVDVTIGMDQHGRALRSHVDREIHEREAAVVRRIFELYASGLGLKAIAGRLTNEGAPYPTPFNCKDPSKVGPIRGWAPATIRAILGRELYCGKLVWGKTRKRTSWGR